MASSRTPPLLERYLAPPPETSLVLLTNVLGATSNWLVLRYLCSLLGRTTGVGNGIDLPAGAPVVFASFLRGYEFWKECGGKLGLDFDARTANGRLAFLDGTTCMLPGENPRRENRAGARVCLSSPEPESIERALGSALDGMAAEGRQQKPVLVVDQLDLIVAVSADRSAGRRLREMLLRLRQKAHACILTMAADNPLVASQATTLEKEHATMLLATAHEADLVVAVTALDTGAAGDVSGVLRITGGGRSDLVAVEEQEYLYHVGVDGAARVFERGQ